jgi:hypothetical protein
MVSPSPRGLHADKTPRTLIGSTAGRMRATLSGLMVSAELAHARWKMPPLVGVYQEAECWPGRQSKGSSSIG